MHKMPKTQKTKSKSPNSPTFDEVREIASILRVLGDPTRLKIAYACLDGPITVSEIAARVDISPSLVSHHLRPLRHLRIVRDKRKGREIYYSHDDQHIQHVLEYFLIHLREIK